MLVVNSASVETVAKMGPLKEASRLRPLPIVEPVVESKTRRNVDTELVNRAPKNTFRLLLTGTKIPPAPPVTSCNKPKICSVVGSLKRNPAVSPAFPS